MLFSGKQHHCCLQAESNQNRSTPCTLPVLEPDRTNIDKSKPKGELPISKPLSHGHTVKAVERNVPPRSWSRATDQRSVTEQTFSTTIHGQNPFSGRDSPVHTWHTFGQSHTSSGETKVISNPSTSFVQRAELVKEFERNFVRSVGVRI